MFKLESVDKTLRFRKGEQNKGGVWAGDDKLNRKSESDTGRPSLNPSPIRIIRVDTLKSESD